MRSIQGITMALFAAAMLAAAAASHATAGREGADRKNSLARSGVFAILEREYRPGVIRNDDDDYDDDDDKRRYLPPMLEIPLVIRAHGDAVKLWKMQDDPDAESDELRPVHDWFDAVERKHPRSRPHRKYRDFDAFDGHDHHQPSEVAPVPLPAGVLLLGSGLLGLAGIARRKKTTKGSRG